MKISVLVCVVLFLTACGASSQSRPWDKLREPEYMRAKQEFTPTFAELQMALFKHNAACGKNLELSVDPRRPSYASLIELPENGLGREHAILVDFVQRENRPVRGRAYSYYAGAEVDARIRAIFNGIKYPESCTGEAPEQVD